MVRERERERGRERGREREREVLNSNSETADWNLEKRRLKTQARKRGTAPSHRPLSPPLPIALHTLVHMVTSLVGLVVVGKF